MWSSRLFSAEYSDLELVVLKMLPLALARRLVLEEENGLSESYDFLGYEFLAII